MNSPASPARGKTDARAARLQFEAANKAAAEIILRDIFRYGVGSLMVEWAHAIINGTARERPGWRLAA